MGCASSKDEPSRGGHAPAAPASNVPKNQPPKAMDASKGTMFIALYDYDARTDFDLGFRKNDKILVVDQSNKDWWVGKLNDKTGYIPANYVTDLGSNLGVWFHKDCSRKDAERLLQDAAVGMFLIRNRETNVSGLPGYSLSVRAMTSGDVQRDTDIRHYKIVVTQEGNRESYFISDKLVFESLDALIAHYKLSEDGLCIKLGEPCPRVAPKLNDLSPETADKWEIPREDIEFIALLGSGQFGEVWSAWYRKKSKVAVKTMKPGTMKPDAFLLEAKLMKKLQHKHLVRLYAVCTKEEPMYIITELVGRGCLLKFLRENEGKNFSVPKLIGMAADVADAMVYLESLNFIHRDLAARNVLVDINYSCKVCDFGLARCVQEDQYQAARGAKFPVKWTAPEAANYGHFTIKSDVWSFGILMYEIITRGKVPYPVCDFGLARCVQENTYQASKHTKFPIKWTAPEAASYGHFTIKSDVWSFGILMYEIITRGKVPYPGMNNREVVEQIENGYRMPQPENCPEPYYKLMRNSWNAEATKRPTFEYLFRALSEFTTMAEKQYDG